MASNGLSGIVCGEPSSALNDARRDVHEGNSAILGNRETQEKGKI